HENLEERTFEFAIRILDLLGLLPVNRKTGVIISQMAKAGTTVGANYEESQASHSKGDFYFKIGICLREARESNYWLRIINRRNWLNGNELLDFLVNESAELKGIFGKIYSGRNK
ncbi:MAG: four helix bundle protein, partial [Fidelibacterota bacterium]